MATRIPELLCVLMTLFLSSPVMAQGDEFPTLPRPKGPDLREQASNEWQKFQKAFPSWMGTTIKYTSIEEWGTDQVLIKCFHKDEFWVENDEIIWKENGKCWVEKRATILGRLNTLQHGTLHLKLGLSKAMRTRIKLLKRDAEKLMTDNTLESIRSGSPNATLLKDMAKEIPYLGDVVGLADLAFGTGGVLQDIADTKAALNRFLGEYVSLYPKLGLASSINIIVVTVTGSYEQAVTVKRLRTVVHTNSKITELPCDDEVWKTLEEGKKYTNQKSSVPISGKAADLLNSMLNKVADEHDDTELMVELRKNLVGQWTGVGVRKSEPTEPIPVVVEFRALAEGGVVGTFIIGTGNSQRKIDMQVQQKDWYEHTFKVRMTEKEADEIRKIREKGFPVPFTTYEAQISLDGTTITAYELDKWRDTILSFTLHRK